jgi:hypothetical protein
MEGEAQVLLSSGRATVEEIQIRWSVSTILDFASEFEYEVSALYMWINDQIVI